jgi:hypothetical protein
MFGRNSRFRGKAPQKPVVENVPSVPNSQVPFTQAQLNEQAKFASATPKMGGPNQLAMLSSGLGSNPMPPAGGPNQRGMMGSGLGSNPAGGPQRGMSFSGLALNPAGGPVQRGMGMTGSGFAKGGSVGSKASKRADGCAQRGKTKGRFV